jgi:acetyl esterase/lipase
MRTAILLLLICPLVALGNCASVGNITVNTVTITRAEDCVYSVNGISTLLAGEEGRKYSVYYLPGNQNAIGPTPVYIHGGGWSYPTISNSNKCSQLAGCEAFVQKLLARGAVAVYAPIYNLSAMRMLTAPMDASGTTVNFSNIGAGFCEWPTSATPNYQIVVDQGNGSAETMTVTAQNAPSNCSGMNNPTQLTVAARPAGVPHNTININLGSFAGSTNTCTTATSGWAGGGCGGTPGTYAIPFAGGGCSALPTGRYTIASDGTIQAGLVAVTSNGTGCTSQPTVNFVAGAGGWPAGCAAFNAGGVQSCRLPFMTAFFSVVGIAATQWPNHANDLSAFFSYLATCGAGGSSPGSGACNVAPFAGQPVPGNPMDLRDFGDSAGAHLALRMGQAGSTYLDTNATHDGYSEWSSAGWKITATAAWSVPVDIANMYSSTGDRSATWALGGLLGWSPTNFTDVSPLNHVSASNPRMLAVNGTIDAITPLGLIRTFVGTAPNTASMVTVTGQQHELDTWTYPGLTLHWVEEFLLPAAKSLGGALGGGLQ